MFFKSHLETGVSLFPYFNNSIDILTSLLTKSHFSSFQYWGNCNFIRQNESSNYWSAEDQNANVKRLAEQEYCFAP